MLPELALAFLTSAGTTIAPQTACVVFIDHGGGCTQTLWMEAADTYVVHGPAAIRVTVMPPVTHPAEALLPERSVLENGADVFNPSYTYTCWELVAGGDCDVNMDGDNGTDADIEEFFAAIAGRGVHCGSANWDGDEDTGTDADIEAFYRSLAGGVVTQEMTP